MISSLTLVFAAATILSQAELNEDELTDLLQKKRHALTLAADVLLEGVLVDSQPAAMPQQPPAQFGEMTFFKLAYTLTELAKVDMQLTESAAEQIKLLEGLLAKMQKINKQVEVYQETGLVTTVDAALFRAGLAEAEIMLFRQKQDQWARRFDGSWYSPDYSYGFRIHGSIGIATENKAPKKYRIGDIILRIKVYSENTFHGEQIFSDGVGRGVKGTLIDANTIQMEGGNYTWTMVRK